MSELDLDNIKSITDGHTSTPSPEIWSRIDAQLDKKVARRRISRYRTMAIAASLVAVISCMTILTHYVGHHREDTFATNEEATPMIIEPLEDVVDVPYYNVADVHRLHRHLSTSLLSVTN